MKAKGFNAVKYGNPLPQKEVEEIAKEAVEKTLKEGFKPLLAEKVDSTLEDKVMPANREHLTKNKMRLNEALMKKWCNVSTKEGK